MKGGSVGGFGGSKEGRKRRDRLMVGFWEVLRKIVEVNIGIIELFLDRMELVRLEFEFGLYFLFSLLT